MNINGFTLVELIVVIVLMSVLAAFALPRFVEGTDQARVSHAQASTGAFTDAIVTYRSAWIAENKPATIDLDGKTVTYINGFPHPATHTAATCMDLWDTAFRGAEPIQPYVAGAPAPAWSTLAFGTICLYVYHDGEIFSGSNPLPFFWYRPQNGSVQIQKFNMS